MLGRCPQLNVAPEAALSLIVGNTIRDFMHEYPEDGHESDLAIGISVATAITVQVLYFTIDLASINVTGRLGSYPSCWVF